VTPVLRATGLTVSHGSSEVLSDVDVEIHTGQWTTIVGPNGAGKTTLLRAIIGGVKHSGRVEIEGTVDPTARSRSQSIALVPHDSGRYPQV